LYTPTPFWEYCLKVSAAMSKIPIPTELLSSSASDGSFCKHEGELVGWGTIRSNVLGDMSTIADTVDGILPTPRKLDILRDIITQDGSDGIICIKASLSFSCALTKSGRVLVWGIGSAGQLGNYTQEEIASGTLRKSSATPILVNIPKAQQIACGGGHIVAVTRAGDLYAWGLSQKGQAGQAEQDFVCRPSLIRSSHFLSALKIASVSCGSVFTVLIARFTGSEQMRRRSEHLSSGSGSGSGSEKKEDNGGKFYSVGRAFLLGSLPEWPRGGGEESSPSADTPWFTSPEPLHWPEDQGCPLCPSFKAVACGDVFVLLLDEGGRVWACGDNSRGALGQWHNDPIVGAFVAVQALPSCKSIAAGSHHGVALSLKEGQAYSWGATSYGQCGRGNQGEAVWIPPAPIVEPAILTSQVQQVSCSATATFLISRERQLYSCGDELHGILGHGRFWKSGQLQFVRRYVPTKVLTFNHAPVLQISAGNTHALAILDNETVSITFPLSGMQNSLQAVHSAPPLGLTRAESGSSVGDETRSYRSSLRLHLDASFSGKIDPFGFLLDEHLTSGSDKEKNGKLPWNKCQLSKKEEKKVTDSIESLGGMVNDDMLLQDYGSKQRKFLETMAWKGLAPFRTVLWSLVAEVDKNEIRCQGMYSSLLREAFMLEESNRELSLSKNSLRRLLQFHARFRDLEEREEVINLLRTIFHFNKRIVHSNGMCHICVFLLLHLGEEDSFWVFRYITDKIIAGYFASYPHFLLCDIHLLSDLLHAHIPQLMITMEVSNLQLEDVVGSWFRSLFLCCLRPEIAMYVWDLVFLHGRRMLFVVAISLLAIIETPILNACHQRGPGFSAADLRQIADSPESHLPSFEEVFYENLAKFAVKVPSNEQLKVIHAQIDDVLFHKHREQQKHESESKREYEAARIVAASALQRWYRSEMDARRKYLRLRRNVIRMQALWRGYSTRKSLRCDHRNMRFCIVQLRKFQAARNMRRVRREFLEMRGAAIVIQRSWRSYVSRTAEDRARNKAATLIQHNYIARLHRQRFIAYRHSVILVQRAVRSWLSGTELARQEKRKVVRVRVATEIVTTERTYLHGLLSLRDQFWTPLVEEYGLKPKYGDIIFGAIPGLITLSESMLTELEDRIGHWTSNSTVGDIFIRHVQSLRIYVTYCDRYEKALVALGMASGADGVEEFLAAHDIYSLLITPVQRIPRYELLIKELLKQTSTKHADFPLLSAALAAVKDVAFRLNQFLSTRMDRNSAMQTLERMFIGAPKYLFDSQRYLIREGSGRKQCRKIAKRRAFFLFNDCLAYATTQRLGSIVSYHYHNMLPLEGAQVQGLEDTASFVNAFRLTTHKKSFEVYCDSADEKLSWLIDIRSVILSLRDVTGELNVAPVLVPDHHHRACMRCQTMFTFTNRRHHCRNCGLLLCGNCCMYRCTISYDTSSAKEKDKEQRVCESCYKKIKGF
jgi:alpha-tubulin suppressor-like RCC1 family protein